MEYLRKIPQFKYLTKMQQKFLMHYFTDGKGIGRLSAELAGYSPKGATQKAHELLKDSKIKMIIAKVQDEAMTQNEDLRLQITAELCSIAFSNITQFMTWANNNLKLKDSDEIPEKYSRIIEEVSSNIGMYGSTMKIKLHNKLAAIKELNQMYGFYSAEKFSNADPEKEVKQTQLIILPSNGREKTS